ncbi:MAG: thioredoxin-disulfide reductase [Deltaproteobacteria bacterium]|nr:thioredoxin-disulfide reductase [Deltaproteobacteria bacterium]
MSEENKVEDVIICGTGPAGYTAALYTARANLNPLVFDGIQPGGQLTITTDVENYPGFEEGIMGPELMEVMRKQVERFGTRFVMDSIIEAKLDVHPFELKDSFGRSYKTKTLIIATGASARYLGLENETRLQGYGVSACATCDGFFYRGLEVAVVGGGDSACEEANFLTKFATTVHLLVRRDEMRASKIMQDRVINNPKIKIHWNTEVLDVLGEKEVTGIKIINNKTQESKDLTLQGFFLAIGHTPNSAPFVSWLDHDDNGYLITQPDSTLTNIPGVFACGDVQDHTYRQAVTAAGSGCKAALDAERFLEH